MSISRTTIHYFHHPVLFMQQIDTQFAQLMAVTGVKQNELKQTWLSQALRGQNKGTLTFFQHPAEDLFITEKTVFTPIVSLFIWE